MVKGIGTDIVEVSRFRDKPYETNKSFYEKMFTYKEIEYCLSYNDPYPHFAVRFAGKEAVLKAIGGSVIKNILDIEIANDESRKPYVITALTKNEILISLSHCENYATATVIVSSKEYI
jgi:holo-[acyl-carrier protein] synthase